MNRLASIATVVVALIASSGCAPAPEQEIASETVPIVADEEFSYLVDRFTDFKVIRFQVPGFEELTPRQRILTYYLSMAGLAGRDIIFDQNYKHNLRIRRTLEAIVDAYGGDRTTAEFEQFMDYSKMVWFSNGIHHFYSTEKLQPEFSAEYFAELVASSPEGDFPLLEGETIADLVSLLTPIIFDPEIAPKRVNLAPGEDLVATSSNNYYGEGITQEEVEAFYSERADPEDPEPISWGLNSKMVEDDGELSERTWKISAMYGEAIKEIVGWLEKAATVAENDRQKRSLEQLVEFYKTGELRKFSEYSITWAGETEASVDSVNGFIETYGDPLGMRAAFESYVSFKDLEATKRVDTLARNAQWFEDNSTLIEEHKKAEVKGISAKVITIVTAGGDAYPSQSIGINLPNPNWIRKNHGSKSVTLGNIIHAYNESGKGSGLLEEYAHDEDEIERARVHGGLGDYLHTDMHEVIGHASGQIEDGVGTPAETLKNYAQTIEEGRADLVALYYLLDPKLIELGVMDTFEVGKEEYDLAIRNGLMVQLVRLKPGEHLEEAHMRNRQMVAAWVYEKGLADNVIEKVTRDGKTYFEIHDYEQLRELFGELLREVQRIKSQGDFEAARDLVENYGVKVDSEFHAEVLERFEALDVKPYKGLINPKLTPVVDDRGEIVDVELTYGDNYSAQMMEYSRDFSFLPHYN
jgi:dipeptidyl-peptidase-3